MPISLMPLPYAEDALAPAISADTLKTHHGKHHNAYVTKTNDAVKGTALADASLEEIIADADKKGNAGLFNNSAQVWNHGFYWHSLSPEGGECPDDLAKAIDAAFGSKDDLVSQLVDRGTGHFASGWVWLVAGTDGTLSIAETHDAGTLALGDKNPLLTLDVWEHAYYIDYKNVRPDYLKAATSKLLNWSFAAENLSRGTTWTYPA